MTKRNDLVWLLAILSLVLGCKDGAKSRDILDSTTDSLKSTKPSQPKLSPKENVVTDIYTQAAIETCSCMHPMIEKAKLLQELKIRNQLTDMKKIAEEMKQIEPQIQKCSDEIHHKYSQINNHDKEKRIYKALLKQCPDLEILFSSLGKVAQK